MWHGHCSRGGQAGGGAESTAGLDLAAWLTLASASGKMKSDVQVAGGPGQLVLLPDFRDTPLCGRTARAGVPWHPGTAESGPERNPRCPPSEDGSSSSLDARLQAGFPGNQLASVSEVRMDETQACREEGRARRAGEDTGQDSWLVQGCHRNSHLLRGEKPRHEVLRGAPGHSRARQDLESDLPRHFLPAKCWAARGGCALTAVFSERRDGHAGLWPRRL